jgi:hypothetical protein
MSAARLNYKVYKPSNRHCSVHHTSVVVWANVRDDESNKVEETRTQTHHRITLQLLYLSQRARPDLRLAVSSLGRRVTKCDEDDWKKLGRAIRYLEETIDLPLRL